MWVDKGHKHVVTHFNLQTIIKNISLDSFCQISSVEAVVSCNSSSIRQNNTRMAWTLPQTDTSKIKPKDKEPQAAPALQGSRAEFLSFIWNRNYSCPVAVLKDFSKKHQIECWAVSILTIPLMTLPGAITCSNEQFGMPDNSRNIWTILAPFCF